MRKASKWADWLEARFVTLDVTKAGATPSMPSQPAPAATVVQQAKPELAPQQQATPKTAAARSVTVAGFVPRTVSFSINKREATK